MSLQDQLKAYAAYHRDGRNKATHFVGVPLVTFSLFLFLSWFRFVDAPKEFPMLSGAAIFYLCVLPYYLSLDLLIALLQLPVTLALLYAADRVAVMPFQQSLIVFLATFIGGWIIQLVGHAFEGRRPALTDNLMQIFNAPLFLTAEVLLMLGIHKDYYSPFEATPTPALQQPELQDVRA
jgi:uncharacterized membrane protein YGL010W